MGFINLSGLRLGAVGAPITAKASDLLERAHRGVYYVSQDNYAFVVCDSEEELKLYADSATSCIIVVMKGRNKSGQDMIAITHLSRTARFETFFSMAEQAFQGDILVYASGANPAEPIKVAAGTDYTALRNTDNLRQWVSKHAYNPDTPTVIPPNPRITGNGFRLGTGNPSIYSAGLDCYGVKLPAGAPLPDRQWMADSERDETGGLQTLFCIYGAQDAVRPQYVEFTQTETDAMIAAAKADNFDEAADKDDEWILEHYSSTPQFEVPWFCDTIRAAAAYVAAAIKTI